jgi:hypothetical protein
MPAQKQFETIDEYIKTYPIDVQKILAKMSGLLERPRLRPKKRSVIRCQLSN